MAAERDRYRVERDRARAASIRWKEVADAATGELYRLRMDVVFLTAERDELRAVILGVADCSCSGPLLDWEAGTFKVGKQADDCYPDRDDCPHMQALLDVAAVLATKETNDE